MPSHGDTTLKCVSLTLVRTPQSSTFRRTPPATIRWVHSSNRPARQRPACVALLRPVALADGVVCVPMTAEKARTPEHSRECPHYPAATRGKRERGVLVLCLCYACHSSRSYVVCALCSGNREAGAMLPPTVFGSPCPCTAVSHTRIVLLFTTGVIFPCSPFSRRPRSGGVSLVSSERPPTQTATRDITYSSTYT